jgi:hypothetical protein
MFNKFLNRKEGASPQKDSKKPPKSKADDTLSQVSMTSQVN